MTLTVVYDACVLYSSSLRDFLIRLARLGLVQPRWTDDILDETFTNLTRNRPSLDPQRLRRTRELMNAAVPDALVTGYVSLIPRIELPDLGDRHVVAAAITCGADVIVTWNLRDFPADCLEEWKIQAVSPDELALRLLSIDAEAVLTALSRIAEVWRNPPGTVLDVVDRLEHDGLTSSSPLIRARILNG